MKLESLVMTKDHCGDTDIPRRFGPFRSYVVATYLVLGHCQTECHASDEK
jgi:hypothetical protein